METITIERMNKIIDDYEMAYNHFTDSPSIFVQFSLPHLSGNASLGIVGVGTFENIDEFELWCDFENVDRNHRLYFLKIYEIEKEDFDYDDYDEPEDCRANYCIGCGVEIGNHMGCPDYCPDCLVKYNIGEEEE